MRWLIILALVTACGDDKAKPKDGGIGSDGSIVSGDGGGSDGGTQNPFAYCLDKPDATMVQRPPTAGLPCSLLPPVALQ